MKTLLMLLSVSMFSLSCSSAFDCQPRVAAPTGDLAKDILGSWDGFGIDSRVVATFHSDGGVTHSEQPNSYAPQGGRSTSSYQIVDGGIVVLSGAQHDATVSTTALTLTAAGGTPRAHPALTCKGQEFE